MAEGEATTQSNIRVLATSKALKIEPFRIPDDHLKVGRAWEEWIEDFEDEITYFEIKEIRDKISALKIYDGPELKKLARNLPDPAPIEADDDYQMLKRKLNNHFLPKKNKHHARYTFSKQRMESHESIVTYAARMREARDCEFGDQTDDRILEHLIQTVKDNDFIKKCIQKRCNLDQFIEEASQREDIGQQVRDMKDDHKIARVYQRQSFDRRDRRYGGGKRGKEQGSKIKASGRDQERKKPGMKCDYCKKTDLHRPGQNCPAFGKQCLKCDKYNHFATCCKSGTTEKPGSNSRVKDQRKKDFGKQIKKIGCDVESSSGSDDEFISQASKHVSHHVKRVRSESNHDTVLIRIGDIDVNVEPDSGASANIMDEYQFRALHHRSKEIKELKPSKDTLKTLQSTLTVKGEFQTTLRNRNRGTTTKLLVIEGKMDSPPLLCKNTLVELGMLRIEPRGTLKETNELRIKAMKQPEANDLEELLNEYNGNRNIQK